MNHLEEISRYLWACAGILNLGAAIVTILNFYNYYMPIIHIALVIHAIVMFRVSTKR